MDEEPAVPSSTRTSHPAPRTPHTAASTGSSDALARAAASAGVERAQLVVEEFQRDVAVVPGGVADRPQPGRQVEHPLAGQHAHRVGQRGDIAGRRVVDVHQNRRAGPNARQVLRPRAAQMPVVAVDQRADVRQPDLVGHVERVAERLGPGEVVREMQPEELDVDLQAVAGRQSRQPADALHRLVARYREAVALARRQHDRAARGPQSRRQLADVRRGGQRPLELLARRPQRHAVADARHAEPGRRQPIAERRQAMRLDVLADRRPARFDAVEPGRARRVDQIVQAEPLPQRRRVKTGLHTLLQWRVPSA